MVFKSYIGFFKNIKIFYAKYFIFKKFPSRSRENVCAIVKDILQIAINPEINTEYIFIFCLHMGRFFLDSLSFLDL